jgi:hypothetical protein
MRVQMLESPGRVYGRAIVANFIQLEQIKMRENWKVSRFYHDGMDEAGRVADRRMAPCLCGGTPVCGILSE